MELLPASGYLPFSYIDKLQRSYKVHQAVRKYAKYLVSTLKSSKWYGMKKVQAFKVNFVPPRVHSMVRL